MEIKWGTLVCITHEGKEIKCVQNARDYINSQLVLFHDWNGFDLFMDTLEFECDKLGIPAFL